MKKKKVVAPKKPKPGVPAAPPETTHFAVPVVLFGAVVKTLETLPYAQVSTVMEALKQCQPLGIPGGAQPGATVPGLGREEG